MSITSVATPIWNDLARTQSLRTNWAKKVFAMNPEQIMETETQEYRELIAQGIPHTTASPFLDMKPLLLENEAISRYIQETGNLDLRAAMPEVTTISEAVDIVLMERPLDSSEQRQLVELLKDALDEGQ